jgi:hypothetical protein
MLGISGEEKRRRWWGWMGEAWEGGPVEGGLVRMEVRGRCYRR